MGERVLQCLLPSAAVIATPSGLPEQWKLCAFMHNSDTGPNNAIVFHSWASTNFSNISVVFWSLSRVDALAVRRNEKKKGVRLIVISKEVL